MDDCQDCKVCGMSEYTCLRIKLGVLPDERPFPIGRCCSSCTERNDVHNILGARS